MEEDNYSKELAVAGAKNLFYYCNMYYNKECKGCIFHKVGGASCGCMIMDTINSSYIKPSDWDNAELIMEPTIIFKEE